MPEDKKTKFSSIKEKQQLLNLFLYRYFNIFNILIFIIIIFFGYIAFLSPKYSDITKGVELSNLEKRDKLDNMSKFLSRLNRYRQDYNEIDASNIERLNLMLPAGDNTESLYTEIETLVKQRGLELSSLEVAPEERTTTAKIKKESTGDARIGEIKLKMKVAGANYSAFKTFISTLENNLRITDVTNLSYSPGDMSLSIDAVTYYLK